MAKKNKRNGKKKKRSNVNNIPAIRRRIVVRDLKHITNINEPADLLDLTPTMRLAKSNDLEMLKKQRILDLELVTQFDEEYKDIISKRHELFDDEEEDDDFWDDLFSD